VATAMELDPYMREIESLVQHLSPQASLLGDMDLHVIEELYGEGIPLEAALAGIRAGARRLAGLKRAPRGLPLKRVRTDVRKAAKKKNAKKKNARSHPEAIDAEAASARTTPAEDDSWRDTVREMAEQVSTPFSAQLAALADDADLGAERAFVRLLTISQDYYQCALESLDFDDRDALIEEIAGPVAPALKSMLPEARQQMLEELARRRLAEADPVLDPDRFWQDE
jgi:hypothetical protein